MEEKLEQINDLDSNCIKVVLYGPESTGKSTLAKALAQHYDTVYVEEFSRQYAKSKFAKNQTLTAADVIPIAMGQMQLENEALPHANKVLICDTDLLETYVYSQHYYDGYSPEILRKKAFDNHYHLYFLTYIDTVWEADDIRDRPHDRSLLFESFLRALQIANKPYVVLKGSFEERLNECQKHIDKLLKF